MQIILLKDVKGVGRLGDIVQVLDGYGRNFLLPRNLAKFADKDSISQAVAEKKKADELAIEIQNLESKLVENLTGLRLEFSLPADKKGHLYTSLKETEILAKIRKGRDSKLADQARLVDYSPLKTVGLHPAILKLGSKLAEINIFINAASGKKS